MRRSRLQNTFYEPLEARRLLAAVWSGYAGGPQHEAVSSVASQPLNAIRWQTPVDLNPQYSGNDLFIHYGTPLVTQANTVIVPVKTGASDGFKVEALSGADGSLIWSQTSDYTLPSHDWTPSYAPALTAGNRIYFAGAGGTVYYRDSVDSATATGSGQIAFYGLSNYNANPTAYQNSIHISTPLTVDAAGDIFFGYQADGTNPLGITDGFARIGADGSATYTSAATVSSGAFGHAVTNAAPAVSLDGQHIYVVVSSGLGYGTGDLLELSSSKLTLEASVALKDPSSGQNALLPDISTASPMVGPDGDVYFGVLENPFPSNHDRGWMLHFSGDLSQVKTPGAFGWDDTASVVPASMVPSYHGSSTYLLMTKYNNYADPGLGGDGVNKIAILDPNATMTDPITGAKVMNEMLTIAGVTPDPQFFPADPNAVREWCINTAVVDPATDSILANSEDGKLYRWNLTTNTFSQVMTLTSGIGEAYTPTLIGADGAVYAINNATLFAVGFSQKAPHLTIAISDGGVTPAPGQNLAYTLNYSNTGTIGSTGAVLTETLPANTTFDSADSSSGWTLASGSTYTKTIGTIASGGGGSAIFAVTVNNSVPPGTLALIDTASIADDSNVANNTASVATNLLVASAGLNNLLTSSATAAPGTAITFTDVVTNDKTNDVTGATVSIPLPGGIIATGAFAVNYTSSITGGATHSAPSGTGAPGGLVVNDTVNMPAGATITYTIHANISSAATSSVVATAASITPAGIVNQDANGGSSRSHTSTDTVTLTPVSDLYVSIAGYDPVTIGGIDVYTIDVTNNGPSNVTGAKLVDTFSNLTGVSYTSSQLYFVNNANTTASAPTASSPSGTLNGASPTLNETLNLSAGSVFQFVVTGTVAAGAPSTLTNNVTVAVPSGTTDSFPANNTAAVSAPVVSGSTSTVVGRSLFYLDSGWDGLNTSAPKAADFNAIATDKLPLLPGQTATYQNVSNYQYGINGIFIDIKNDPTASSIAASDFQITSGNTMNNPGTGSSPGPGWSILSIAPTITRFAGMGVGNSERIALSWPKGTIAGKWIEVTLKAKTAANSHTGLASADVFYFGSAPGDTGDTPANFVVNATDEADALNDPQSLTARITDPNDFNRDKSVNSADETFAHNHNTSLSTTALKVLTAPSTTPVIVNGSISGSVYDDKNGNGIQDIGEGRLSNGWTIDIKQNNVLVATMVTDLNGNYYFGNLKPGTYDISIIAKPGYTGTGKSVTGYHITLGSGQKLTGYNFLEKPLA